jgi:N-hydroxyarylamine O-acetyltransferase
MLLPEVDNEPACAATMQLDSERLKTYLERIDYDRSPVVTPESLRDLQLAHLLTVPFENLSIHAHEAIALNDEALYAKIVARRRGGFCYELNGLFACLLRSVGFPVEMLSARVADSEGRFSADFDHMALLVKLEQNWLVDVGFGDSFREPLLFVADLEQEQGTESFRLVHDEPHWTLFRRKPAEEWLPQYRFTLQPYGYADFEARCWYQQTSPDSHFTKGRMCSRATPQGRITLSEMRFITTSLSGERDERSLDSAEEYALLLKEEFGIVMLQETGA